MRAASYRGEAAPYRPDFFAPSETVLRLRPPSSGRSIRAAGPGISGEIQTGAVRTEDAGAGPSPGSRGGSPRSAHPWVRGGGKDARDAVDLGLSAEDGFQGPSHDGGFRIDPRPILEPDHALVDQH